MRGTDTGVTDMELFKKLVKRSACPDCTATYHITMTGEDGKKYIVPIKIKFCPFCGRRLS